MHKKISLIIKTIHTICRGKEARDMLFIDEHNNITSLPDRSIYQKLRHWIFILTYCIFFLLLLCLLLDDTCQLFIRRQGISC